MLVIILGLAISILLTTYLVILTRTTRASYNQLRSEISYQTGIASLKETLITFGTRNTFGDQPVWPPNITTTPYTDTYTFGITNVKRKIYQEDQDNDGIKETIFEITTDTLGSPRKIIGRLVPPIQTSQPVEVSLIIDTSGSMLETASATDTRTKLAAAQEASTIFIQQFKQNQQAKISIISFDTYATLLKNLTTTTGSQNDDLIATITNQVVANSSGSTNIGGSLKITRQQVYPTLYASRDPGRYVVFLTDGIPTVNDTDTPCISLPSSQQAGCMTNARQFALDQAMQLKDDRTVAVFTIGLGKDNEIDQGLLQQIASTNPATGNPYYYYAPSTDRPAPDQPSPLETIYRDIAQTIVGIGNIQIEEVKP